MRTFYIIANTDKDVNLKLSHEIADYLIARGKHCVVRSEERRVGKECL